MKQNIAVEFETDTQAGRAQRFARQYGLPLATGKAAVCILFSNSGVTLVCKNGKNATLRVNTDFVSGALAHRRRFGGGFGQNLAKAVGIGKQFTPHIIDATAGLGRDAFVLASLGAQVTLVERSPIVHLLLEDGLQRARHHAQEKGDNALATILARMDLVLADGLDYLYGHTSDIVYLDPMFPERKKSALVKKEMQVFQRLLDGDEDADVLLEPALASARYRVVVKRPRKAPFLAQQTPSFEIGGKTSRFDIYVRKALPSV